MDMKVDYIDDAFDIYNEEPLGKILIMDDPARISRFYNWLVDAYGDRIFAAFSYDFALEIGAVSKGVSMLRVAEYFGISPKEIIALGDGQNDIDMLTRAGLAVAMENAMDEVKDVADFITLTNNNSGVAHAINKFILEKSVVNGGLV
jgi:hydroxymethylpyrimidine pyrophosphatase-like HAD family hydrolase